MTSGEMNLAGKSAEKWSKQKQEKKERLFEQVNATLNLSSPRKFGESALYTCLFKRCLISAFCPINRFCIRTTFLGRPEFLLMYPNPFFSAKNARPKRRKYPTTWSDNFTERHFSTRKAKILVLSSVVEQRQK